MTLRELLKQREDMKENAAKGSSFPEGVTKYVKMGRYGEVNSEGKNFVILAEPNDWHAYFVHEDSTFTGNKTVHKFQKHTCLHVPKKGDNIYDFLEKGGLEECPTCAAMTHPSQRKMYFIIPVFDLEYEEMRVIDTKEFHAVNIIKAYDNIERTAKKFQPDYSLVGQAVKFLQDDKTFTLTQSDWELEEEEKAVELASKVLEQGFDLSEDMFMRERPELVKIIRESEQGSLMVKVVDGEPAADDEGNNEVDTH